MKHFLIFLFITMTSSVSWGAKLPKQRFHAIIGVFTSEFQSEAEVNGRELEFLTDYQDDWAQSFARRWEKDQVIVYGGMAALKNGSEDSLALILCHELGHLYGGVPFMDEHNELSAEGQADYWSPRCFEKILPKLSDKNPSLKSMVHCEEDRACARALDAALVVSAFYADNRSLSHPQVETPDLSQSPVLIFTHPTPQCRLDTILSGLELGPKPPCWFKP